MRILYFTRSYSPHDRRFLDVLARSGHEVGYLPYEAEFARREPPVLPEGIQRVKWDGVERPWALAHNRRALRKVLEKFKPDLVHAGPVQQPAFLTALTGFSPLVTMSWGSDILLGAKRGIGRHQAGYTLQRSTLFLCDCKAVSDRAEELGMPAGQIVVFPWGVDLEHFSPGDSAIRENTGWQDAFILLSTRSMEPLYDVDVTVEAFIRAAGENSSLRLLLLGDGSMREQLENRLEEAGLAERSWFAGRVNLEQLPAYYRASDLYITSSTSDGSSISLLEAMACGLPAVVSDIPGNREWVTAGKNGWLFPVGGVEEMAGSLLEAAGSGGGLLRMGSISRDICEKRADWRGSSQLLLQAYERAREVAGAGS